MEQQSDRLCQTADCVRSAAAIIEKMDLSKDPCEDFYDFACGNFVKTKVVPFDHSSRNILQEIQDELFVEMKGLFGSPIVDNSSPSSSSSAVDKAKMFYTSCMNHESKEDDEKEAMVILMNLIEESGGSWCAFELLLELQSSPNAANSIHDGSDIKDVMKKCKTNDNDGKLFDIDKRLAESFMNQIPSLVNVYVASPESENSSSSSSPSSSSPYALHVSLSFVYLSPTDAIVISFLILLMFFRHFFSFH